MTPSSFVAALAALRFESTFNPYADVCPDHDRGNAPTIRRRNLRLVLEAALAGGVESLWIARDLGYRGGRRTGLALTDEVHLDEHAKLIGSAPLVRATRGPVMSERTATVIWQALRDLNRPIFLWNVFPLHPHEPGNSRTNRPHTREERQECRSLLMWLVVSLQPKTVVAIGRDAQLALADLAIQSETVRHPSYGGQSEFLTGIHGHYGIHSRDETAPPDARLL